MTEFKGELGLYKIIKTEDQTETLWSEYFNEACHNISGAYEETIHNYILGCSIPNLIKKGISFSVLDVGFGVGIGLKALVDQFDKDKDKDKICSGLVNYTSIELDETLLLWSLNKTLPFLALERKIREVNQSTLVYYQGLWNNSIAIQIFVGDGRTTLPLASALGLIPPLDAIFQDAFSPRKNSALWSTEWFLFLKFLSVKSVELSTYSSSITIRKSLVAAGWSIENAKGFASKRFMTKASLTGETSSLLLDQLSNSPLLEIKD